MKRLAALALLLGCAHPLQATASQPNPILMPHADALPASEKLFILVGDNAEDGVKVILTNSAKFIVVSRDRLRFHVTIEHRWEEFADPSAWEVWLEDKAGHKWRPDSKEVNRQKFKTNMVDYETRSTVRSFANDSNLGDIMAVNNDGWKLRTVMASYDRFRGEGDYVFSSPGIFSTDARELTLVMQREGLVYRYTWQFTDGGPIRLAHHTQGLTNPLGGYMTPGPITQGQ